MTIKEKELETALIGAFGAVLLCGAIGYETHAQSLSGAFVGVAIGLGIVGLMWAFFRVLSS